MSTRIYQNIPLKIGESCKLDERASHYLMHVLRAAVGDDLILFNGLGGQYRAQISAITKKAVTVLVQDFEDIARESPLNIHLIQGIAKGEKMDFIIQKAVELGVKKITPVITSRCNVRLSGDREIKRTAHWNGVLISACEQCGRNRLPKLMPTASIENLLPTLQSGFVLSPHASQQAFSLPENEVNLLIGPEGGLTEEEISLGKKQNMQAINLGPRILRTETATIAALSILQGLFGDMGGQACVIA